jgi:hypothetical protein
MHQKGLTGQPRWSDGKEERGKGRTSSSNQKKDMAGLGMGNMLNRMPREKMQSQNSPDERRRMIL